MTRATAIGVLGIPAIPEKSTSGAGLKYFPKLDLGAVSVVALSGANVGLTRLSGLEADWDGMRSASPSGESIALARDILKELYVATTRTAHEWRTPLLTGSESGAVVMEWWKAERKVTIYVESVRAEYLCVWGNDPISEMEDGELRPDQFDQVWSWLQTTSRHA